MIQQQRVTSIPAFLSVRHRAPAAPAAAAIPWWLAGGAPAPVAVYQPKGAASLAASYVNLANPGTYDAAPGVAPTFDAATGLAFDGSTQWLSVSLSMPTTVTLIASVVTPNVSGTKSLVGGTNSGALLFGAIDNKIRFGSSGVTVLDVSTGTFSAGTPVVWAGAINWNVYAHTYQFWLNGSPAGNGTGANTAAASGNIKIGGSLTTYNFATYCRALAIYNTRLNDTQVAAVSTAMAAL